MPGIFLGARVVTGTRVPGFMEPPVQRMIQRYKHTLTIRVLGAVLGETLSVMGLMHQTQTQGNREASPRKRFKVEM